MPLTVIVRVKPGKERVFKAALEALVPPALAEEDRLFSAVTHAEVVAAERVTGALPRNVHDFARNYADVFHELA